MTATRPGDNNRRNVKLVRAVIAALLVVGLPLGQTIAPAHAHEDADHHVAVVHQHVTGHDASADHDDPEFDHGNDNRVLWLVNVALPSTPVQTVAALSVVESVFAPDTADELDGLVSIDDAAPSHGPPRTAHSYRGPPSPLA